MKKYLFFAFFLIPLIIAPQQLRADALDDAIAIAQEARQQASDFECSSYFPSEWEAAEAVYTTANSEKTPAAYHNAAAAFNTIFTQTIPLYTQAREDEIMEIRGHLIALGARDTATEYFTYADETAVAAFDLYEAGNDYYTARDTAAQALAMYQVLADATNAWLLLQEIREREFESYDQENFDSAAGILAKAMDEYDTGDYASAQKDAEESRLRLQLVLSTAWAAYADTRSSLAMAERDAALEIKANIATRELFAQAETQYKKAVTTFDAKKYEEAAMEFIDAETMFMTASVSAAEKRRIAADAIKELYIKIEESDQIAAQAESILKGGE